MLSITKVNNSIKVEGLDNKQFPDNGTLMIPLNSVILTLDESNIATFRSAANNDVLFSGVITDIQIDGTSMTKQTITTSFANIANSSGGGGGTVDAYTKAETDALLATKANESELSDYATVESLATVATTGSYNDLSNKPVIPTVPTNVSAFTNDAGYLTQHQDISGLATKQELAEVEAEIPSLEGYATQQWVENQNYLTEHQSLDNYYTKTQTDTAISTATNDMATETWVQQQGYLTQHQDISGLATKQELATHTENSDIHVTAAQKTAWSAKADLNDIPDVTGYIDGAVYDSQTKRINFKHGNTVVAYIDATPFVVDGMVDTVEITGGNLVVTWNTDAGKQSTSIPLTDIFNPSNYYDKTDTDTLLAAKANSADLATVATSGDYDDLTNKPTIPTVPTNVSAFTNDAGYTANVGTITGITMNGVSKGTSGNVDLGTVITEHQSLAGYAQTADLATVATTGSYTDLTDKPNLFSGDYNDLTNKPTIPDAQINSDWTEADSSSKAYIQNKPNLATVATTGNYSDLNGTPSLATVATSGDYDDLTNKPTIPAAQVQSDWNQSDNSSVDFIKNKPTLATVATTGDYDDLTNKPTIPTVPTNVSAFTNDAGYTTNTGTITGITMNGASKGTSGVVDLGTVVTDKSDKQDTLVSGTNIKTINNESILGSGNITISGGSSYTAGDGIDITNNVISVDIDDEKKVIASALVELHNDKADKNQLNNYQLKGDYQTGAQVDTKIATATSTLRTEAEAINVEKVDAAALTDLNARVSTLEQGGGGSGITGITMNGSAVTVTSGVANLGTVVTDVSGKQDTINFNSPLSYNQNSKTLSLGIEIDKGNSGQGNLKMNGKTNYQNNVTGDYSVALGTNNTVSGNCSAAIGGFDYYGDGNTVSGYSSVALGRSHNIAKHMATATGQGHTISNSYETAVGRYSQSNHSTDTFGDSGNTLFAVGNGTSSSARSNAFEVRQNGDIYISNSDHTQTIKLQDNLGGGGGGITGITMNGSAVTVTSGVADLGTVITEHQSLSNYYTKTEIDAMIGNISSSLDTINGEVI